MSPRRPLVVLLAVLLTGARAEVEFDLASATAWTLRLDGGPARPVIVPGGGWNSDRQTPPVQTMQDVRDSVLYERTLTVPREAAGQTVELRCGGVNYGCEVFLDGTRVGEHHGPQVAFAVDLTRAVVPGTEQRLALRAFHRRHYLQPGQRQTAEVAVGWDFPEGGDAASRAEAKAWSDWHGQSKVGYGIVRSIALALLPAVHVADVYVHTSVSRRQFSADLTLANGSAEPHTVTLAGTLSAWNRRDWAYPASAPVSVTLAPHATAQVTLGPVPWELGPESYWWPNIPFREDYTAQLHQLELSVREGDRLWQTHTQRFGFVEHAEGPYYYTVNGVRVTGFSDGTPEGALSVYDAYGSSPAFTTGCAETWRRYLRAGLNTNRLHCSPPTERMLAVADEVGFMLVPEAPIWGNGFSRYNRALTPQTYRDLGRACRNHPCVARYSLANEVREPLAKLKDAWPWRAAIDDLRAVDDSRPYVFELHGQGHGRVEGLGGGHAWIMDHYTNTHEVVDPGQGLRGLGEHWWTPNALGAFAVDARLMRCHDWAYMAGWCWVNYWPNFLAGMSHDQHAWRHDNHADRRDGVDGWGSPLLRFVQRSFDPYLIQDRGVLELNPGPPRGEADGLAQWPYQAPVCVAGRETERSLELFNGGLDGQPLSLAWTAHWDQPDGPVALAGGTVGPLAIAPGFHQTVPLRFTVPAPGADQRALYLVLATRRDGRTLFQEDGTWLKVVAAAPHSAATFLGTDDRTQGNWPGQYGADGYELVGREPRLPAYATLTWRDGQTWCYDRATDDPRALAYFANPPTGRDRLAAVRYADEVGFDLSVGAAPRRLSLYQLDYDRKSRRQRVTLADTATGAVLDQRELDNFANGRYQSWTVQGSVTVTVRRLQGDNAALAGVFLDPAPPR